jgi:Tfp pilus assembly protein PilN
MITINLAPPATLKRGVLMDINLVLIFGALFALLVGSVGTYGVKMILDVSGIERDIARTESELARLRALIAEGQALRLERDDLQRRVDAIEAAARSQLRPAYLLDAVADAVPADVWLTRLEEKGRQLRVAGGASSAAALSTLLANLTMSGKFREMTLVESRQDLARGRRGITFEVACRFEI